MVSYCFIHIEPDDFHGNPKEQQRYDQKKNVVVVVVVVVVL